MAVPQISNVIVTIISGLAFTVSLYGVWEKRRDVHQQQLLRLSSVVDELNKLSYEQDRLKDEIITAGRAVPIGISIVSNSRREILCSEATSLIDKLREEVTPSQLRAVAASWGRAGYPNNAEPLLRQVIMRPESDIDTFYGWRGLASLLIETGRENEGRDAYLQALGLAEKVTYYSGWEKGDTYIRWAQNEAAMGYLDCGRSLLADAEKLVSTIRNLPRRNELARRISSARINPPFSPVKETEASAGKALPEEISDGSDVQVSNQ